MNNVLENDWHEKRFEMESRMQEFPRGERISTTQGHKHVMESWRFKL